MHASRDISPPAPEHPGVALHTQMFEALPVAVCVIGRDGRLQMYNRAAVDLWGRTPSPDDRWCGSLHASTPAGQALAAERYPASLALRTGRPVQSEEILIERPDGTRRYAVVSATPLVDEHGTPTAAVTLLTDVTERRASDAALRASEERYRALVEGQTEMICRFRRDGTILFANQAYARTMVGREAAELEGVNLWGYVEPTDRPGVEAMLDAITPASPQVTIENRIRSAEGSRWTLWTNRGLAFDERGVPSELQSCGIDITDRKLAERALFESESRFRQVANSAPVMIWISGPDTLRHWFNQRWLDFVASTIEDQQGHGWMRFVHPADLDRYLEQYLRAFEARAPFTIEYRLRRHDGVYRWVIAHATPMHNADAEFTGYIGTSSDITERKELEQERERHRVELEQRVQQRTFELTASHERLRLAERLAKIGTLAAGLGHDMGNLLAPLLVRLDSLEAQRLSPAALEDVEAVRTSTDYFRRLASGLRMLAIDPRLHPASDVTDIAEWWADAAGVYKCVLPRGIALSCTIAPALQRVGISRPALTQVVFNLVQNAGDALRSRTSGSVRVEIIPDADHVLVRIIDDGPGMDPDVLRRCMEPFFSTKGHGASTGLGLMIVHDLVRSAGGSVSVDSHLGRGTTFTVRLPAVEPQAPAPASSHGRALVAVRDGRLRSVITGELRALRFEVMPDGPAAPSASLAVLDADALDRPIPGDVPVIVLADAAPTIGERVTAVGPRPGFAQLRDALRNAARLANADARRRDQ
jgi:PAS domain S-box-containing protein